jgi:pimeloyl-ACP methyl ester carboxylesterase
MAAPSMVRRRPLHGWPYDIHSYVDVVPLLAAAGCRVTIAYLRGFGTTRFLWTRRSRNGEQAALALDVIALMDALGINSAIVAGFDRGARTKDIVAALWPGTLQRARVGERLSDRQPRGRHLPLPPEAELQWWYQYYFATERGRAGYDKYPARVCEAHLANRLAEVELRRRHVRSQCRSFANAITRDRDSQLSLAAGAGGRRTAIRRAGVMARRRPSHHRARHHARGCRQRCAPSGAECLCHKVLGQVFAPDNRGHRTHPSPGSAGCLRRCRP